MNELCLFWGNLEVKRMEHRLVDFDRQELPYLYLQQITFYTYMCYTTCSSKLPLIS